MKKFLSVLLSLVMLFSIATPLAGAVNAQNYNLQVLHASGVNEFGTNIYDQNVAEYIENVPATIVANGEYLYIHSSVNGENISLEAKVQGKSWDGDVLYYDTITTGNSALQPLSIMYFDTYSDGTSIFTNDGVTSGHRLSIYLKDVTASNREYYFIEVYDFELTEYKNLVGQLDVCGGNYWNAKEFRAIDFSYEELPTSVASPETYRVQYVSTYTDPSRTTFKDYITIEITNDYIDIPVSRRGTWYHGFEVVDKQRICVDDPSLNNYEASALAVSDVKMKIGTPPNCGFSETALDGGVYQSGGWKLSADIGYSLDLLGGIASLNVDYEPGGSIDLDETTDIYINSGNNYTRALEIELDNKYTLRNENDSFKIKNVVTDYGNEETSSSRVHLIWYWTIYDVLSGEDFKIASKEMDFMCKVS